MLTPLSSQSPKAVDKAAAKDRGCGIWCRAMSIAGTCSMYNEQGTSCPAMMHRCCRRDDCPSQQSGTCPSTFTMVKRTVSSNTECMPCRIVMCRKHICLRIYRKIMQPCPQQRVAPTRPQNCTPHSNYPSRHCNPPAPNTHARARALV